MLSSRLHTFAGMANLGDRRRDGGARVRLASALLQLGTLLGLYLLPLAATLGILAVVARDPHHPQDFVVAFLGAARAIGHGHSPYPQVTPALLNGGEAFVYPPPVAWLLVPLTWLPLVASSLLVVAGTAVAVVAALRLLGVTDPRCYGLALLWNATIANETVGAISGLLLLAVALAWRWRDTAVRCGLAVAVAVTAKLFLWPLAVWLAVSRRLTAAAVAVSAATLATAVGWAAIGFAGLSAYPHLLSRLSGVEAPQSYTLAALLHLAGLPMIAGQALTAVAVVPLAMWAWRGEPAARDRRMFMVAVLASLLLTPIAWTHYFVLLAAVCALSSPRLSAIWFVPLVAWVAVPGERADGHLGSMLAYALVVCLVVALAVRGERRAIPLPA